MTTDSTTFVSKFARELANENAAAFIGAGLSKGAGYVDWTGLLDPVAEELGLDVRKENDLVALAQYYVNKKGANRHQLSQLLVENFSDLQEPTENHRILSRLPIRAFWTTNYDTLIENALQSAGRIPDVKYTTEQLTITKSRRDAVVYKSHADLRAGTQMNPGRTASPELRQTESRNPAVSATAARRSFTTTTTENQKLRSSTGAFLGHRRRTLDASTVPSVVRYK